MVRGRVRCRAVTAGATAAARLGKTLLCSSIKYLYEGRHELYTGLAIDPEVMRPGR